MPHRCLHTNSVGLACTFYLSDDDPNTLCPVHRRRASLLVALGRVLGVSRRSHVLSQDTYLFLEPNDQRFRGTLHCGESVRVLAIPNPCWAQVEVVCASNLPAHTQGWVRRAAVL